MADRIGKLNSTIMFGFIASISSFFIWTFAYNYTTLVGYSLLFGFTCGSYFAVISPISAELLGMEKFPSGLSLLLLFNSIAVFGSNISSAIESGIHQSPFMTYKMFTGVVYLAGALILIFLRFRLTNDIFIKI